MVCVLTRPVAITVHVNMDTSLKRTVNSSVKVTNKNITLNVMQLRSFQSSQSFFFLNITARDLNSNLKNCEYEPVSLDSVVA